SAVRKKSAGGSAVGPVARIPQSAFGLQQAQLHEDGYRRASYRIPRGGKSQRSPDRYGSQHCHHGAGASRQEISRDQKRRIQRAVAVLPAWFARAVRHVRKRRRCRDQAVLVKRLAIEYWLPLILWLVVIFIFSTDAFASSETSRVITPALQLLFPWLSTDQLEFWHAFLRKLGHITEYFVLAILTYRVLRQYKSDLIQAKLR